MRAKLPVKDGCVDRDGVKINYEVYGNGPHTMLFLPPWSFVHSRVYKAQVPYFSERFRCITFDARGNGRSDRPTDAAAYTLDTYVADALAVMDASDAGRTIVIGVSSGGMLACILAAHHPDRVAAAVLVGSSASIGANHPYMTPQHFMTRQAQFDGWNKYNREYWLTNYPDFVEHFAGQIFTEPHSTRQIEEAISWANETTGAVLVKTVEARLIPPKLDVSEAMYRKIDCPVLMIHGDNDQIQPHDRTPTVAELIGAEFVTIPGGGHVPLARFPGKCNILIDEFLDRTLGLAAPDGERFGPPPPSGRSTCPLRSGSDTRAVIWLSLANCGR